jgi:RHS repeat-associated protein
VSDARIPANGTGGIVGGYAAIVKSATDYSAFGAQMDGRFGGTAYRFGFNGQEKVDEVHGNSGDAYDFGARIYDARLGRFLSMDRFASRFPSFSPYLFAGCSPLIAIDVNGDSLYILAYTVGNSDKGSDEMFYAAALTRKYDIEKSPGFDPKRDKVVFIQVTNQAEIKTQVATVTAANSPTYGGTVEFDLWGHSGEVDGPVGTKETGEYAKDTYQMTPEGWAQIDFNWANDGKGTRANFYGCNTALENNGTSFAQKMSSLDNFKNVTVSGQSTSSYPSGYTNYRTASPAPDGDFVKTQTTDYIVFQHTYMVGGVPRSKDWFLNEQNVANKMNFYKDGKKSVQVTNLERQNLTEDE